MSTRESEPQVEATGRTEVLRPPGSFAGPATDPLKEDVLQIDTEDAQPKEIGNLTKLREDMGITENVDPLQALLNAPVGPTTGKWKSHRLNTDFVIRALSFDEYNQIQDQSTRWTRNKRTGRMERDVDANTMSLLTCARGTMNPNFGDPSLLKKSGMARAHEALQQLLLPGEIDSLATGILNLSGFDDDLEDQGKD